jgi:hypothetical protein
MAVDVTPDRWRKYAHGTPRLFLVLLFLLWLQPHAYAYSFLFSYNLLAVMVITGAIGSVLNVGLVSSSMQLTLLLLLAVQIITQIILTMSSGDLTTLVFLVKTSFGDLFAGKIDSPSFMLAFAALLVGLLPAWALMSILLHKSVASIIIQYARVSPFLFGIQLISEMGDKYLEDYVFFRHRYSFEVLTLAMCLMLSYGFREPMTLLEFRVIAADLVSCLSYRGMNALIIYFIQLSERETSIVRISLAIGFKLYSALCCQDFKLIKNPEVAKEVMHSASSKGRIGLESNIVAAAWRPALSLESLDGEEWRSMRNDFDDLIKIMFPSPTKASELMKAITARKAKELVDAGGIIDAQEVAFVTASSFLELVFGKQWEAEDQIFINSSWEWRKEIACRGRGDPNAKQAAVDRIILLLRGSPFLWSIHGEKWTEPERYSLILQPFLISPIINLGDIMCGVEIMRPQHGQDSLEATMHKMHPFPLWERYVDKDILSENGSQVLVKRGTHTIIFPSDVCPVVSIFGAGERKCAGIFLARPLMEEMATTFLSVPPDRFRPTQGHRFSGRHQDSNMSLVELGYLVKTVLLTVLGVWWRSER